ncbi:hypothetical protein ACFSTE_04075 [Aquimarina hainanensis]|uniref:Viral A-type inclusion protein n=1 Tax=Aquimarina hainanensis TaxID=1578017 RepID=A0ABW5N4A3_9FLAO|nr:hypothetical protein [Aquimarina sp. TRL1]QKX06014.1 hypothetical protein HN014_14240 [Aquimarina sp. TRL1]
MKKISGIICICLTTLFFISCNKETQSKEEKEFDALMKQVIDIHDEVMPRMGEISSLIKELKPKIDTTAQGKVYEKSQLELKKSYDHMMRWMSDFGRKFSSGHGHDHGDGHDEATHEEEKFDYVAKLALLKKEKVAVGELRDEINSSIENAKKLLGK